MNVGLGIKKVRTDSGLTQEVIAEKACLTQGYYSLIESGLKEPTLKTLRNIANALNTSIVVLVFLSLEKEELNKFKKLHSELKSIIASHA